MSSCEGEVAKALARLGQLVQGPCGGASFASEFVRAFNEALWAKWAVFEGVVKFVDESRIEDMLRVFLLNEYFGTFSCCLGK